MRVFWFVTNLLVVFGVLPAVGMLLVGPVGLVAGIVAGLALVHFDRLPEA